MEKLKKLVDPLGISREILFRAQNKNNDWKLGSLEIAYDGCTRISYWTSKCTDFDNNVWEPVYHLIDVNPVTVGEFSSLTDSANTKIFEGDIFPVMTRPATGLSATVNSITMIYGEVVFHNAMFCIRFKHPEVADPYTYVPLHEFLASGNKIIAGNIHDNKDL